MPAPACPARDIAAPAWSFAQLPFADDPLWQSIASQSRARISDFDPQGLANPAWSFAALACPDRPLLPALSSAAIRRIREFNVRDIASTAWAVAKLGFVDHPLLQATAAAALPSVSAAVQSPARGSSSGATLWSPQVIAAMAWSYSRLEFIHAPLLQSISAAALTKISQFTAQQLANPAWSCAKLNLLNTPLLAAISAAAIAIRNQFVMQGLSNIAWSYSTLPYEDCTLLAAISAEAIPNIRVANPQELANLAWSVSALADANGPLRDAIAAASLAKIHEFIAQQLANLAWSFATLRLPHGPLLEAISAKSISTISQFVLQGLANPAWSYAFLPWQDLPLLAAISAEAIPSIQAASPMDLANLAWSVSTLAVPHRPLLQAISAAAIRSIRAFQVQDISNTAWAFAALAVEDRPLITAISSASIATLTEFSLQHSMNLAWACATLPVSDAPLFDAISAASIRQLASWEESEQGKPQVVLGIVHAFALAGRSGAEGAAFATAALLAYGERLDRESSAGMASRRQGLDVEKEADGAEEDQLTEKEEDEGLSEPRVVWEDRHICVLLKPPGWTVSVDSFASGGEGDGAGPEASEPLHGRAEAGAALQAWVKQTLGASLPIARDVRAGHGLVHRLDRGTSGLVLCARSYRGFWSAQVELVARRVRKEYVCLCHGHLEDTPRVLEERLATASPRGGVSRTVVASHGRHSSTELLAAARCIGPEGHHYSLVEVLLHTGRRHQIRAHLSAVGHPLVGDALYGEPGGGAPWCARLFLHAHHITVDMRAGGAGGLVDVRSGLPRDLREAAARLSPVLGATLQEVRRLERWRSE